MAKTNVKVKAEKIYTGGGGAAVRVPVLAQLRRSVLSCLLWEDSFYEDGSSIADRIKDLVHQAKPADVANLAIEAREEQHLRHVPLLLVRELARHPMLKSGAHDQLVSKTLARVIQRADEPAEFLSLYWKDGKEPLSKQVKRGLAWSLRRFSEYELAKYNRDGKVRLRDVLFLSHATPKDEAQAALWKRLAENKLETPDTWEVALSKGGTMAGVDQKAFKKLTFERLMTEGSLGYLALLRNLRNMEQAEVDAVLIKKQITGLKGASRVLPFRFIAAAKAAPHFERELDDAMVANLAHQPKLPGKTLVVVDVSGSMYDGVVSKKSDMNRALAACSLAAIVRELGDEVRVYATAGSDGLHKHRTKEVPARRGMALVDAIYGQCHPLGGGGIFLTQVMAWLKAKEKTADRVIVITDEQDCGIASDDHASKADAFGTSNYLLNVAAEKNGIGYKPKWLHIDGWSESVVRYILAAEQPEQQQQQV